MYKCKCIKSVMYSFVRKAQNVIVCDLFYFLTAVNENQAMLALKALGVCEPSLCCAFLLLLYGVQSDSSLTSKTLELMSKYRLIDG